MQGWKSKREFYKNGKERLLARKGKWRINADGRKMEKRRNKGEICDVRGNGERSYYSRSSLTGRGDK